MILLKIAKKYLFWTCAKVSSFHFKKCEFLPSKKLIMCKLVVMAVDTKGNDLGNTYSIAVICCFEKEIVKTLC